MKKGTKIWLIVAVILSVLGIGLCIVSFALGVTSKDLLGMANHGLFSFDSWWMDDEDKAERIESKETIVDEYAEESVNSHSEEYGQNSIIKDYLYIDMDFGKITVKSSNSDAIALKCEDVSDERYFNYKETEDSIYIENQNHKLFGNLHTPEAILYLPENFIFQCVEIDIDAGECVIEVPVQAKQLVVDVDAGNVDINDLSAEWADLDCDAGKIQFHGLTKFGGQANVDAGDIEIELGGYDYSYYNYMIEVDVGSIHLNDTEYSGLDIEKYIDHQSEAEWTLDCDAGVIKMKVFE